MKICTTLKAALLSMMLPLGLYAETPLDDYAAATRSLAAQETAISALAEKHGRYSEQLVEPLQQLIHGQMEVSRLEDAADNVDYAIHIVRTTHGLNTPRQYDLQQLAIDIDLYRQDWKDVNQRLDHYSNLLLSEYLGPADDFIMRMLWLGDAHVRGAIEDDAEKEAQHLRSATWYATTAVSLARKYNLTHSRLYADMLYSLSQRYYLEARAILDGGSTSYRLRMIQPGIHHVRDKFVALNRRYQLGLNALLELRDTLAQSPGFSQEAVAMAEFHIADWKALFDESEDLDSDYDQAISSLLAAGLADDQVQRFLAQPVVIPRAALETRIDDILELNPRRIRDGAQDRLLSGMSLLEPSPQLAGFAQEARLVNWRGSLNKDWAEITVSLTVNPGDRVTVRNSAFRTRSRVTPSMVALRNTQASPQLTNEALDRIQTLSFRPAFVDGKAVTSEVELDYLVRDSEQRSITPLVTGNWVASFRVKARGASPAAAGE
jgi:hypothetical protein